MVVGSSQPRLGDSEWGPVVEFVQNHLDQKDIVDVKSAIKFVRGKDLGDGLQLDKGRQGVLVGTGGLICRQGEEGGTMIGKRGQFEDKKSLKERFERNKQFLNKSVSKTISQEDLRHALSNSSSSTSSCLLFASCPFFFPFVF